MPVIFPLAPHRSWCYPEGCYGTSHSNVGRGGSRAQEGGYTQQAFLHCGGLLFLLLGGLILFLTVILIAGPSDPEFMTYTPPAEDAPPTPQPTTQDLTSKPASSSHDVAPSVIVAVGAAPVQMAQVDVPVDDSSDGTGLELGVGLGTGGLGTGLGSGGNGLGDGKGGGSALEGTFYDFKQTRQGSPTGISGPAQMKCMEIIYDFMKNNWNPGALSKYTSPPPNSTSPTSTPRR